MNIKKIKIKEEEVLVRKTIRHIEADFDFTQIYDWFYAMSMRIKSAKTFNILFYMLKDVANDNILNIGKDKFEGFNAQYEKLTGEKGIIEKTFYNCIKELEDNSIIKRLSKGRYSVNYHLIFRDEKDKRIELIRSDNNTMHYNPIRLIEPSTMDECN
jgi:hypothetical protein